MAALPSVRVEKRTCGNISLSVFLCICSISLSRQLRGAYCAMVVHALLDLPLALPPEAGARQNGLETFTDGLPEYLSRCKWRPLLSFLVVTDSEIAGQTYEGGISGSPGTEAHGAYAFCALACLCLLGRPEVVVPR
jgi:protein farnesyltransferase subunit beta